MPVNRALFFLIIFINQAAKVGTAVRILHSGINKP